MSKPARAKFQSTHPVRGGTAGWDIQMVIVPDFNPPTPCGVGPEGDPACCPTDRISIHPPRAGWDPDGAVVSRVRLISIHPPRAGWDTAQKVADMIVRISIHPPRAGWDGHYTSPP